MTQNARHLPVAARIANVQTDNYRTKTFVLDADISAYPGQFVMLWLPGFDEKPFSLVDDTPVTVMVTAVGPFTRLLHERHPGDQIWFRGPFGHGFSPFPDQCHALLVGGGYGVAPLLWLARRLLLTVPRITAVIGARTQSEILYADRFQMLFSQHGSDARCDLLVTTDDGTVGRKGLVTDAVRPLLEQGDVDGVYACGPGSMLAALRQMARDFTLPCQLSWEAYMRCGMGLCGACEFEGALLCMDGPVLSFKP